MNRCRHHLSTLAYEAGLRPRFARLAMCAMWFEYDPCRTHARNLRFAARRLWKHERSYQNVSSAILNDREIGLAIAACEYARAAGEEDGSVRWLELADAARRFARLKA